MEYVSTTLPGTENAAAPAILVADDEPSILLIVSRVITLMNYAVLTVGNGLQAVETANQQRELIYCAILDIDMPLLNGIQAAHTIRQLLPYLPIIFISGYVPPHVELEIAQLHTATLLKKPFTVAHLRETFLATMSGIRSSSLVSTELSRP